MARQIWIPRAATFGAILLLASVQSPHAATPRGVTVGAQKFEFASPLSAQVELSVPSGWRAVKDFYGIPVTLLGPEPANMRKDPSSRRAVLQIIPAPRNARVPASDPAKISAKQLQAAGTSFAAGKKKWFYKMGIQKYQFRPTTTLKVSPALTLLKTSVDYQVGGRMLIENNFYGKIGSRFVQIKSVVPESENNQRHPEIQRVIASLRLK
ncbi:MAG: hypothetical protein AAB425_06635 [Bdellovibrionota bacterium]